MFTWRVIFVAGAMSMCGFLVSTDEPDSVNFVNFAIFAMSVVVQGDSPTPDANCYRVYLEAFLASIETNNFTIPFTA